MSSSLDRPRPVPRIGDPVLRGEQAQTVVAANFDIDLRQHVTLPPTAPAGGRGTAVGGPGRGAPVNGRATPAGGSPVNGTAPPVKAAPRAPTAAPPAGTVTGGGNAGASAVLGVPTAGFTIDASSTNQAAQVHAAGYAAGWAQGRQAAQQEVRRVTEQLAAQALEVAGHDAGRVQQALSAVVSAVDRLEQRVAPGIAEVEAAIVAIGFQLAEAIVGRELEVATNPGRDAVVRALSTITTDRTVTIRLNPSDLATLADLAGGTVPTVVDGRPVALVAEPTIAIGDAIAECDTTTVDARLATAVDRARKALLE